MGDEEYAHPSDAAQEFIETEDQNPTVART